MDPALTELQETYKRGDLVLFVGAGISAAAGLPSWPGLVAQLVERAKARGTTPPMELDEINDYVARQQLINALSALKASLGPNDFCAAVEQLVDDSRVAELPEAVKAIGSLRGLRAVLTTNLDRLLERAFAGDWEATARATADIARRRQFILKLHGTRIDRSTWVFTREEYDRAMHADELLKQAFASFFNACTLLFVGYGLDDDDFNAVLGRVRAFANNQAPRHFALVEAKLATPYKRRTLEQAGLRLIPYENPDGRHSEVPRILRGLAGGAVEQQPPQQPQPQPQPQLQPQPPQQPQQAPRPRVPLPHAEVLKIHAAAVQVGLVRNRTVLLGGLDVRVISGLPIQSDPAGQMMTDLLELNGIGTLADGTAPLAVWLANALALASARSESGVFSRALATIEGR